MSRFHNRHFAQYRAPAHDGDKARCNAQALLVQARTVDHLDAQSFARSWGLKIATAEAMIAAEKRRRNNQTEGENHG